MIKNVRKSVMIKTRLGGRIMILHVLAHVVCAHGSPNKSLNAHSWGAAFWLPWASMKICESVQRNFARLLRSTLARIGSR